jgi:acyl-CoA thioester hydrolase
MQNQLKIRIYYKDTDAGGIVYYSNYLNYFEAGRAEYARQAGLTVSEIKEKFGVEFAVRHVDCDYLAPSFLDDEIVITTEILAIKGVRIVFLHEAIKAGQVIVKAKITTVAVDMKTLKPTRIPQGLEKLLSA